MLTERHLENYAEVLLWAIRTARTQKFKKNDVVMINFDLDAIRLAEILQGRLLHMGMNPILRFGMTPMMEYNFYGISNKKQLEFVPTGEKDLLESLNGSIHLRAPSSLTHLSDVDPKKIGEAIVAKKPLRDILRVREEKGLYGWTLCTLPTDGLAKEAGLSFKGYTQQVVKACYLDKPAPVNAWREIYREVTAIKRWLNSMKAEYYHIEGEGVDLKITPGRQRKWIGLSGHNIPSFEIFLSPDWRGTEGTYYANQPSFRSGNYVEGVRLTFRNGAAKKIEAEKGRAFLNKQLSIDKGASRVGEFSLTDRRFSRIDKFMANTLYDENYGGKYGNCHLAVGSSYSDSYDGNPGKLTNEMKRKLGFNDSALHWDLVNTQKKMVTAKLTTGVKRVIYENGVFKV